MINWGDAYTSPNKWMHTPKQQTSQECVWCNNIVLFRWRCCFCCRQTAQWKQYIGFGFRLVAFSRAPNFNIRNWYRQSVTTSVCCRSMPLLIAVEKRSRYNFIDKRVFFSWSVNEPYIQDERIHKEKSITHSTESHTMHAHLRMRTPLQLCAARACTQSNSYSDIGWPEARTIGGPNVCPLVFLSKEKWVGMQTYVLKFCWEMHVFCYVTELS